MEFTPQDIWKVLLENLMTGRSSLKSLVNVRLGRKNTITWIHTERGLVLSLIIVKQKID